MRLTPERPFEQDKRRVLYTSGFKGYHFRYCPRDDTVPVRGLEKQMAEIWKVMFEFWGSCIGMGLRFINGVVSVLWLMPWCVISDVYRNYIALCIFMPEGVSQIHVLRLTWHQQKCFGFLVALCHMTFRWSSWRRAWGELKEAQEALDLQQKAAAEAMELQKQEAGPIRRCQKQLLKYWTICIPAFILPGLSRYSEIDWNCLKHESSGSSSRGALEKASGRGGNCYVREGGLVYVCTVRAPYLDQESRTNEEHVNQKVCVCFELFWDIPSKVRVWSLKRRQPRGDFPLRCSSTGG